MQKRKTEGTRPCPKCGGTGVELDNEAVGAEMRRLRQAKRLTLRQVAQKLGFSIVYLSDLELGRRSWRPELREAYLSALQS